MEKQKIDHKILREMELLFTEEEMAAYFETIEMTSEMFDLISRKLALIDVDRAIDFVTKYSYLLDEGSESVYLGAEYELFISFVQKIIAKADYVLLDKLKRAIVRREKELKSIR